MERHSEIAMRAYHIWEREGCPHGRDFEHWLKAEREMQTEMPRPARRSRAASASPAKTARKPRTTKS